MYFDSADEDIELYTVEVDDKEIEGENGEYSQEEEFESDGDENDEDDVGNGPHDQPPRLKKQEAASVPYPMAHRAIASSSGIRQVKPRMNFQRKFTAREKWILVELVDHCKHVLLSKSCKVEVRKRKAEIWIEICDEINGQCGQNRMPEHIRKLWEYMGTRARKASAENKKRSHNNQALVRISPLFEKIMSIFLNVGRGDEAEQRGGGYRSVEVEQRTDGDIKLDWFKESNEKRGEYVEYSNANAIEEMRKLLLTTAAPPRSARRSTIGLDQKGRRRQTVEPLFDHEVTYPEVLEAITDCVEAKKRMIEARELMEAAEVEMLAAKKAKLEAENYNLTIETLKMKHLLGDLNIEFAIPQVDFTKNDGNHVGTDEEDEVEL